MNRTRFLMIGGFLGAGKTTAMARLARHYVAQGRKVALVTNDQAADLVDTASLKDQGFHVGQVAGSCFCCRFDALVETIRRLGRQASPDVIVAEPVGSCTDLAATVIEPLRRFHGRQYDVGPLAVLLKPEHGRKILSGAKDAGFSPKAAYIFLKQIEEADVVAINKVDKLSAHQRDELVASVQGRFPGKRVLTVSALYGDGFPALVEAVSGVAGVRPTIDVDYDVYAEGEAELGWLNCTLRIEKIGGGPIALDDVLVKLVRGLGEEFRRLDAETAHVKVLGRAEGKAAVANLVGSAADVELSRSSGVETDAAELIVNARVALDPERLERVVAETVASLAGRVGLSHATSSMQCFRPGRPRPTHRLT